MNVLLRISSILPISHPVRFTYQPSLDTQTLHLQLNMAKLPPRLVSSIMFLNDQSSLLFPLISAKPCPCFGTRSSRPLLYRPTRSSFIRLLRVHPIRGPKMSACCIVVKATRGCRSARARNTKDRLLIPVDAVTRNC
jgi:hypothetical protein